MKIKKLDKRCYSINEVKDMYSLGRTSLYKLMDEGYLKYIKVGRRRLIPASALDELDNKLSQESVSLGVQIR